MDDVLQAGERALLEGMVDRQRAEIAGLLDGLSDAEARARLVPSLTTPLGLVKHAIFVEKVWFQHRVDDRTRAEVGIPESPEESFVLTASDTVASVVTEFLAAGERSREIAAGHDLGEVFPWRLGDVSLRYIYAHLIAEFARHAGHGDILVEQIKARRGL